VFVPAGRLYEQPGSLPCFAGRAGIWSGFRTFRDGYRRASSPVLFEAPGSPSFHVPHFQMNEGDGAPGGATFLLVCDPVSGTAASSDAPPGQIGPGSFCGVFTAMPGRASVGGPISEPPTVSQLLAGGRSASGRSPGMARVRGCEPRPRAPHRPRPGIAGRRPGRRYGASPPHPFLRPALTTPHDSAPRRSRMFPTSPTSAYRTRYRRVRVDEVIGI